MSDNLVTLATELNILEGQICRFRDGVGFSTSLERRVRLLLQDVQVKMREVEVKLRSLEKPQTHGWKNDLTRTIAMAIDNNVRARSFFENQGGKEIRMVFLLGVDLIGDRMPKDESSEPTFFGQLLPDLIREYLATADWDEIAAFVNRK